MKTAAALSIALLLLAVEQTGATAWATANATLAAYNAWLIDQCGNGQPRKFPALGQTIYCANKETQP